MESCGGEEEEKVWEVAGNENVKKRDSKRVWMGFRGGGSDIFSFEKGMDRVPINLTTLTV